MAKAKTNIPWLPLRAAAGYVASYLGCTEENVRLRINREVEASRVRARGVTSEGYPVSLLPASWRGIDWDAGTLPSCEITNIKLCRDDLIAADLLPVPNTISLREALERGSFEKLQPYLHTGRIPASRRALYSPEGTVRSGPGAIPPTWWANAYKDPAGRDPVGRVFFTIDWVENGCLIRETMFAYPIDINLNRTAYETFFPVATGPAKSRGMWIAQKSILEQNAEAASSASAASSPTAPQIEPVPPAAEPVIADPASAASAAPPSLPEPPPAPELAEAEPEPVSDGEPEPAAPAPADAPAPVANTEAPVAEPPPVFVADEEAVPASADAPAPAQRAPEQSEMPPPGEQPDEAAQWGLPLESPQAVASEESPPPREPPGESTVGSAGGETAPAPASAADASAPVANTEAPAAEPEGASSPAVDAMTTEPEVASPPPADAMTAETATPPPEPATLVDAANAKPPEPNSDRQSERRGNPVWDWSALVQHLKAGKPINPEQDALESARVQHLKAEKLTFNTEQDALEYYRNNVQRIDQMKADDGPDEKSVRSANKRYELHQYVTIKRPR